MGLHAFYLFVGISAIIGVILYLDFNSYRMRFMFDFLKDWFSQISTQLALAIGVGVFVFLLISTYFPTLTFLAIVGIAAAFALGVFNENTVKKLLGRD